MKWRRGPRLPDPIVWLTPDGLDVVDHGAPPRPEWLAESSAHHLGSHVGSNGDLAVHVKLELLRGGVADTHRSGPFVAWQLVELELRESALAGDAVHDLEPPRVAGPDSEHEVAEGKGLVGVPRTKQGLERERRVTQPAVPVVPVSLSSHVLRERRRRRRHPTAGGLDGHRLQRDQRGHHIVAIRALIRAPSGPLAPPSLCSRERGVGILDRRSLFKRGVPRQHGALSGTCHQREVSRDGSLVHAERHDRTEAERVGPGDRCGAIW